MSTHQPVVRGGWLEASRERLVEIALAQIPADVTMELKVAAMEALVEKLEALRVYDRWDPRSMESVVLKRNYQRVEQIYVDSGVLCLHVLPDGRIVSGSEDRTIRIWTKGTDGAWSSEGLKGHTDSVFCLQALPDGRIVSGSSDNSIRIWTKGTDGAWSSEELKGHTRSVNCLQALPDGRIVSGSDDSSIRIWSKRVVPPTSMFQKLLGARGKQEWSSEAPGTCSGAIYRLQVLPDGHIVSANHAGTIRIWDGEEVTGGAA